MTMKNHLLLAVFTIALMTLLAAAPAWASAGLRAPTPVAVVSGGIGEEESSLMKNATMGYDLKLLFTGKEGQYLADVPFTISDRSGQVIYRGMTEGPYVMAKLPSGVYRVDAAFDGVQQSRTVRVNANAEKPALHQFRFPTL